MKEALVETHVFTGVLLVSAQLTTSRSSTYSSGQVQQLIGCLREERKTKSKTKPTVLENQLLIICTYQTSEVRDR